jgi:hypothetical protein
LESLTYVGIITHYGGQEESKKGVTEVALRGFGAVIKLRLGNWQKFLTHFRGRREDNSEMHS